jgi:tRNA dimethylallyltransferase
MKKAIIICGPTASGKSDFAHIIAKKYCGEIVNIDSMQVYKQIPVLTASPPDFLKSELPYHLYNFLDIDKEFSVIKYISLAADAISAISQRGNIPIIVGGTGLYINALLLGYNEIPPISKEVQNFSRELHEKIGHAEFASLLRHLDPLAAARFNPNDTQRIVRAFEVFKQTGKSIVSFQENNNIIPLPEFLFQVIFLFPERSFLYQMCNQRLSSMFASGAIEEVLEVRNNFSNISSVKKALGLLEIMAYLENKMSLVEAINITQNKTRQYAKRQVTWFKNQIHNKITIEYSSCSEFEALTHNFTIY